MTYVGYTLNLSLRKHKVEKSRLVKLCHFLKAKVPVALMHIRIQILVVSAKLVTSRVVKPDIEAAVS